MRIWKGEEKKEGGSEETGERCRFVGISNWRLDNEDNLKVTWRRRRRRL